MIRGRLRALPARRSKLGRKVAQQGVSLLLALVFAAVFGAILVTLARFNSGEIRKSEARVAGWEAVEISKAARLYVRDQYAIQQRALAPTPILIPIETLKAGGYLSGSFGRVGAAPPQMVNALNQNIYVVMAWWALNGLSTSADSNAVPAAFVIFQSGGKSSADLMIQTVEQARRLGTTITAPLFDRSGVNQSATCRGAGAAAGLWDTGCITQAEFASITSATGIASTFQPGTLIVPTWRSTPMDMRAVMRFPQPENPGFATMLTDLQMGVPVGDCSIAANQVQITTQDASGALVNTPTDVCAVVDDDAATDRRYNIENIGSVRAQRLIAEGQTQDFGGNDASDMGAEKVMTVTGNAQMGSDLRIYNLRALPAGITNRMNISNGTLAVERNVYVYSQNGAFKGAATISGTATSGALVSDQLNAAQLDSLNDGAIVPANYTTASPRLSVANAATIASDLSVSGLPDAELIAGRLNASNATMRATDTQYNPAATDPATQAQQMGQVQVTGTLQMDGYAMNITGAAPASGYSTVIGQIDGVNRITTPAAVFGNSASVTAAQIHYTPAGAVMPTLGTTGRCLEGSLAANACPDRQFVGSTVTP